MLHQFNFFHIHNHFILSKTNGMQHEQDRLRRSSGQTSKKAFLATREVYELVTTKITSFQKLSKTRILRSEETCNGNF